MEFVPLLLGFINGNIVPQNLLPEVEVQKINFPLMSEISMQNKKTHVNFVSFRVLHKVAFDEPYYSFTRSSPNGHRGCARGRFGGNRNDYQDCGHGEVYQRAYSHYPQ